MRLLFGICFCLRRLTCRMYNPSHAKVSEIKIQWQLCYWFPPWEGALHSQPVAWAERHHLWVRIQHNPLAWSTDGLLVSGWQMWQVGKDFPGGAMFFEPETLPQIIAEAVQAKTKAARPPACVFWRCGTAANCWWDQTAAAFHEDTTCATLNLWPVPGHGTAPWHPPAGRQHSQELGLIVGKWT